MNGLMINGSSKIDPTRTSGIRRRFLADMNGRFTELKRDIKISIVDNNCFGIQPIRIANTPIPYQAFGFERDAQKLEDFLRWLQAQEDAGILSRVNIAGMRLNANSWMDTYIDSAYMQGIRRARAELKRAGLGNDLYGIDPLAQGTISAAFNMPIHAETIAMLYTRVFEDLKTVTSVMNSDLRRTIADGLRTGIARGLAEDRSIESVTRSLMNDVVNGVDKIGVTRARMIARTETVRAHHLASISEYRQFDSELQITVQAEWATANDDRVCDECASMEGKIFSLDEIEGLIPAHPS